ncbi:holo-[acyl-carrier-protein] synthase [Martiniozyma asiatica (nom. inval.)]|nr:holo-[acyl-carrier-protein] synthase [Martiniozyma asiatica]
MTTSTKLFYVSLFDNDSMPLKMLRDDYTFEMILRNLNLKDRIRVCNIKPEIDRFCKIINLLLLKFILNNSNCELIYGEYGKPKLLNEPYSFNLSDEFGVVSLSICDGSENEVGLDLANPVDIERMVENNNVEKFYRDTFRDIFTSKERKNLDLETIKLDEEGKKILLSKCWALKESYCKYLGLGISGGNGLVDYEFINIPPLSPLENIKEISNGRKGVNYVGSATLQKIEGFLPKNICLTLPKISNTILCSLFSTDLTVDVFQIDCVEFLKSFSKSK